MTILEQLNWTGAKKNWCATNVKLAWGIKQSLGNATDWFKHVDKLDNPQVGDVIVMKDKNVYFKVGSPGYIYGHVAVVTKVNGDTLTITDGPTSYTFNINKKYIDGYITPQKMIKLGSTIKINEIQPMGYYEEIFKRLYPNGSTVYSNLEQAKEKFGDIAYFIAIGLEKVKK